MINHCKSHICCCLQRQKFTFISILCSAALLLYKNRIQPAVSRLCRSLTKTQLELPPISQIQYSQQVATEFYIIYLKRFFGCRLCGLQSGASMGYTCSGASCRCSVMYLQSGSTRHPIRVCLSHSGVCSVCIPVNVRTQGGPAEYCIVMTWPVLFTSPFSGCNVVADVPLPLIFVHLSSFRRPTHWMGGGIYIRGSTVLYQVSSPLFLCVTHSHHNLHTNMSSKFKTLPCCVRHHGASITSIN